ncbi:hypothetical protein HPP92_020301 [Vanilla planifolia]|uniref:Uncharacterized protein n=1 Tax=Vanilla planifolia TaxID=51239 RepID=A0A835PWU4_VANPL|nr:hypothetical protein HPP92_020301 [Vanilla planifolia]
MDAPIGWREFSHKSTKPRDLANEEICLLLKDSKSAAEFAGAAVHEIDILSAVVKGDPSNDLKPENVLLVSTIDPAKGPNKVWIYSNPRKAKSNLNGSPLLVALKEAEGESYEAKARISSTRTSMGGVGQEIMQKERTLDGIDLRCKIVDFGNVVGQIKQFAEENSNKAI